VKSKSKLSWDKAKDATRDAWNRVDDSARSRRGSTASRGSDSNRDPLSGAPGSHPVGTGVGAAGGGTAGTVAGAAIGTAIAPGPGTVVGGVIGAVAGAVAGGDVGKNIAESIDPTREDAYWRQNYSTRPYYSAGTSYDEYAPAYRYGWESRSRYSGRRFDDAESDLRSGWERFKGKSQLTWEKAKAATRDAWERVDSGTGSAAR
jgi:hypothetical protein